MSPEVRGAVARISHSMLDTLGEHRRRSARSHRFSRVCREHVARRAAFVRADGSSACLRAKTRESANGELPKTGCKMEFMSAPARDCDSVSPFVLPVELSDSELLNATRRLVGRSNQLLGLLLGHLAEVEARGLHRTRACSSLYTYCIYELRFSEDEAYRRVAAARLVHRFPALLDAVASGELHLTGLLMLGPHLTAENLTEVLARAKHRTKKEIARLVRQLDPLPDVPARIEPLGPASARVLSLTPTHGQFVESLCPVRELALSDRPRGWADRVALTAGTGGDAGEISNEVGLPAIIAAGPGRDNSAQIGESAQLDGSTQFDSSTVRQFDAVRRVCAVRQFDAVRRVRAVRRIRV